MFMSDERREGIERKLTPLFFVPEKDPPDPLQVEAAISPSYVVVHKVGSRRRLVAR